MSSKLTPRSARMASSRRSSPMYMESEDIQMHSPSHVSSHSHSASHSHGGCCNMVNLHLCKSYGSLLLFFMLFVIATWLVLFAVRPSWVRLAGSASTQDIDQLDYPKLLWISVLIGLGALLIAYLLQRLL